MKRWKTVLAILLIAAGVFVLVQGSFTYTKEQHSLELGPLEFKAKNKERVDVPPWVGIGAITGGVLLLLTSRRR